MDTEKIQDHTGDQQKLVDVGVTSGSHIRQFKLFHRLGCFCRRGRPETNPLLAMSVYFQNHIVICLVLPAIFISGNRHHHLMEPENVALLEIQMLIP